MTTADEYREKAEQLRQLASTLEGADSIASDCPPLAELFHTVRTDGRKPRDGRYVALFDYDGEWKCRSVAFLETGTHYRDANCDLKLSHRPYSFLSVDNFARHMRNNIRRKAEAAEQSASQIEMQNSSSL